MSKKRALIIITLALFVPIALLLALSFGFVRVNFLDVLSMTTSHFFGSGPSSKEEAKAWAVVWDIRFPRALMAIIAGAALAMAGVTLQGVLRNPLVSPFVLGISSGASFGAALAIVLGVGIVGSGAYIVIANALLFSLIAAAVVLGISELKGMSRESIILVGIAVMYLFSALVTLLQYIAHEWSLRALVLWVMGDLAIANWQRISIAAIALLACIPLFKYAWDLNTLAMGEEVARSLGTNPRTTRLGCVFFSSLATAAVVCVTGPIGFVCLVSPHIARFLVGSDHRFSMLCSLLLGALLLLIADTVGRVVIAPTELPVGVVMAFLGVPFFLHLLLRSKKEIWR